LKHDQAACQSSADITVPQIPAGMILNNFVSGWFHEWCLAHVTEGQMTNTAI